MTEVGKHIGQLFIVGFPGEVPTGRFLQFIAEKNIGGVILFEQNCPSHLITRENIRHLKSVYGSSTPFIAIDQEGGRVCRIRKAPAEYRAAAEYGRENDHEQFREEYARSAVFMESMGINLNLFPVCDLLLNDKSSCLDGRCFGSEPDVVAKFVTAAVKTAKSAGLLSCLKHFPGLGDSALDPHHHTAIADYDLFVWEQRERIPFQAGVAAGAEFIMTTHLQVPRIDETIITGSGKIITTLLRENLAFDGPVITDELCMSGADVLGEIGPRTVAAFNAGHDLLLFGTDFERTLEAYEYFCSAVEMGEVSAGRVQESLDRVSGIKFKLDKAMQR